jgi:hypothetical protein
MVKKYALDTQMKLIPPPRSATSDGMIVEVTVASRDVRRLMRERTTIMAQNLGPFANFGGFFVSVVASWTSTEASLDSRVEADASCCVIVVSDKVNSNSGCRYFCSIIGRPWSLCKGQSRMGRER